MAGKLVVDSRGISATSAGTAAPETAGSPRSLPPAAEAWSREKLPPQHRGGIPTVPTGNSQRLHGGQPPPSAVRLQDSPELVPWTGHCVPGRQKAQSQSEVSAELGLVLGLHSGAKFKKKSQFNLQGYLCDPHSA